MTNRAHKDAAYNDQSIEIADAPPIFQNSKAGKNTKYTRRSDMLRNASVVNLYFLSNVPMMMSANTGNILSRTINGYSLSQRSFARVSSNVSSIASEKTEIG